MQQAICPLCGGSMELEARAQAQVDCPHCQGSLEAVMNGRAVILKARKPLRQEDPQALKLLEAAEKAQDPVKRFKLLSDALSLYPDSLALNRALLFHGRLHERDGKTVDYSVIKCYLLHPFEAPGEHTPQERQACFAELFEGEQLQKCMALSPDGESFYQDYLAEICAQYVQIFLKGSSRHMVSMFGIPLGKPEKNLSHPAAKIIRAIQAEELLTPRQKEDLAAAFRQGYLKVLGSTDYLDALL